uniref:Uncharacterized protein n=1 Tax=Tanacetum cinerariifolium TaxID=118510 RepID=A0A6L2L1P1_TANCI|nr:hypothetical protein [Tanacetum cinerariifolium]
MNHKIDEWIELLKSLPMETNEEDVAKHEHREQQNLGFENTNFESQATSSFDVIHTSRDLPKRSRFDIGTMMELFLSLIFRLYWIRRDQELLGFPFGQFLDEDLADIGDDVDINTLTMEKYLVLIQDNIRPYVVKPEIGDDFKFEINRNFMKKLRHKLFKGTDDEDAYKHVPRYMALTQDNIRSSVVKPKISEDVEFKINRNFMTELKRKVFKGSDFLHMIRHPTRIMLDSKGFIPLMTPTQALKSIQVMADHLRNWYDGATTRERIDGSSDTKKLNENIHAFQEVARHAKGYI